MNKKSHNNPFLLIFALVLGLMLAAGISVWATTIGNNVDVTGTFTVNGNSTFGDTSSDVNLFTGTLQASTTVLFTGAVTTYGNSTFGDASTDVNLFTGTLQASTTALFTGAVTTYGNVTLGDAAGDTFTVTGNSITYSNAGTTSIPSDANGWTYATSSSAFPFVKFDTSNVFVGIATSAPAATLDIGGDGSVAITAATGTATSTLRLQSRGATRGGCIEFESPAGNAIFRLYATSAQLAYFESGPCR